MKYRAGYIVYYKKQKAKIIGVSDKMATIQTGSNWGTVFLSDIKLVITVPAQLGRRL